MLSELSASSDLASTLQGHAGVHQCKKVPLPGLLCDTSLPDILPVHIAVSHILFPASPGHAYIQLDIAGKSHHLLGELRRFVTVLPQCSHISPKASRYPNKQKTHIALKRGRGVQSAQYELTDAPIGLPWYIRFRSRSADSSAAQLGVDNSGTAPHRTGAAGPHFSQVIQSSSSGS